MSLRPSVAFCHLVAFVWHERTGRSRAVRTKRGGSPLNVSAGGPWALTVGWSPCDGGAGSQHARPGLRAGLPGACTRGACCAGRGARSPGTRRAGVIRSPGWPKVRKADPSDWVLLRARVFLSLPRHRRSYGQGQAEAEGPRSQASSRDVPSVHRAHRGAHREPWHSTPPGALRRECPGIGPSWATPGGPPP